MANRTLFPILLTLLFAAQIQADTLFKDPFEVHQPVLHKVVITPGAKLMTEMGQSALLSAQVIDEAGAPVSTALSWRSTNEALVSVDSAGLITTHASMGSAQIIAEAEGGLSDVAVITIANPVDGAVLIDDDQLVTLPEPVDPEAEFGPGYEYTLTLSNVGELTAGDILIGSGDSLVAGEVTLVTKGAVDTTVVMRTLPLEDLFDDLVVDERIDLSALPIEVSAEIAELFSATRLTDGSLVLSPRETAAKTYGGRAVQGTSVSVEEICKSETTNFKEILSVSSVEDLILDPDISLDLEYDLQGGGFQKLVIHGGIHAVYDLQLRTKLEFEGKIKCKLKLGSITIPTGLPWSLLFTGKVPLGIGVEFSGKVNATEPAGYDLTAVANANTSVGIDCQPNCEIVAELNAGADGTARSIEPDMDVFLGSFQLELNGRAFLFADLAFGNPFLTALSFTAFEVEAGLKQSGDYRSLQSQITASDYASSFKLELVGSAGVANDIAKFLDKINITPPSLTLFEETLLLAESPKGQLVITDPNGGSSATPGNPAVVSPGSDNELGDLAQFKITVDPSTYLGSYSVEEVLIYWKKPDGGTPLEFNSPGCNNFIATSGQTQFTCQADFLEEHVGENEFYTFVKASLFGVPLPFLLEVDKNSTAPLLVLGQSYLRMGDHRGSIGYGADAELRDTVNDETVIKTIEVDEEFYYDYPDDGPEPNFSFSFQTAPNTSKTISSSDGALRSIKIEGTHASAASVSGDRLLGYQVDADVKLTAKSQGYQSGISNYADVELDLKGSINFEAVGAPVYGTLSTTVSKSGSATGQSRFGTSISLRATLANDPAEGEVPIDLSEGDSVDVVFLPGSDNHRVSYSIGLVADADFSSELPNGTAKANATVSLLLTIDP